MAHLIATPRPSLLSSPGGLATELEILDRLEAGLSDAYTLLHGVEWAALHHEQERHGELDVVVVSQSGDVLLLEIKGGEVEFTDTGIFKTYGAKRQAVHAQVGLQYNAMRHRLAAAGLTSSVSALLVLPHALATSQTVQWPRERIVDARQIGDLIHHVRAALPAGEPDEQRQQRAVAFFANHLQLELDVSAFAGQLQQRTLQLAQGLATWVPRLKTPSGLIRVVGTAGSGKTQLAMRMLREAAAQGQRARYVCFNRALADHMSRLLPARVPAQTFHELAQRLYQGAVGEPDFTQAAIFQQMEALALERMPLAPPDLDLLVIDEMQDLKPEWVGALLSRLRPQATAILLEDPEQNLYGDREPFDLGGEVVVSAPENFRSPRLVVQLVNALGLTPVPVVAAGGYEGTFQEPRLYTSERSLAAETGLAVAACLDRGFSLDEVVVLSLRGLANSRLLAADTLGRWTLRKPTGRYDAGGSAIWTEGELAADTVFRFKGQSAPAVVLTEIEFGEWSVQAARRLFVGLTRARVHWEWVMTPQAWGVVAGRLG